METWIKIIQLILSLSILIFVHEMGHMLPAKWFKTRVEKFYLFFNPGFTLFKFKKGETEYGIGWIPLGGYCKIAGMIDESMDKEQLEKPAEPWEYRSKPTWQRLIIITGGVIVNLIVGFLIYIMILFVWGKQYIPTENATYGAHLTDEIFYNYGLQEGDNIIMADGVLSESFGDVNQMIVIDGARNLTILRNMDTISVVLPENIDQEILKNKLKGVVLSPRTPNVIFKLVDNKPAIKAGFKEGDSIVKINELPASFFYDFSKELKQHKGETVEITFYRKGLMHSINCNVNNEGQIGYFSKSFLKVKEVQYTFFEAVPAGISEGISTLTGYVKSFSLIFTKEGAKQLGGFGTIGNLFPEVWDWQKFWYLTALLSIILAFMNILPIPALDGGHMMFLIYEMIAGKAPSEKFLTKAQVVGITVLVHCLINAEI